MREADRTAEDSLSKPNDVWKQMITKLINNIIHATGIASRKPSALTRFMLWGNSISGREVMKMQWRPAWPGTSNYRTHNSPVLYFLLCERSIILCMKGFHVSEGIS